MHIPEGFRAVSEDEASELAWRKGGELSPKKRFALEKVLKVIDESETGVAAFDIPGGDVQGIEYAQGLAREIRASAMKMGQLLDTLVRSEGQKRRLRDREPEHRTTLYLRRSSD